MSRNHATHTEPSDPGKGVRDDDTASRGIRNAFRNRTRSISIVLILGLVIGLAFVMLIAHRAVAAKTATALSSVGNTVTIGPPGDRAGGKLGVFLISKELEPIARLHGVTGVNELLNGALKASNPPPGSATSTGTPQGAPKAIKAGSPKAGNGSSLQGALHR